MRLICLFTATLLLLTISTPGQSAGPQPQPCTLTVSQAPVIRGIKLGMKTQDVLAIFPGSAEEPLNKAALEKVDNYPNFGAANLSIGIRQYPTPKGRFDGISNYRLVSLDSRLVQYAVEYDGLPYGPRWHRVDDFIAKMAEAFHLPSASEWVVDDYANYRKTLKCEGFRLEASILNSNGIFTVATPDPYKVIDDRRREFEEKIKREFKP